MKKTLIYVIGAFISLFFLVGCATKEEKVLRQKRTFLDNKYTDFIVRNCDDSEYLDASRFAERNKKSYIKWTAHVISINENENELTLKEDGLPEIDIKFEYEPRDIKSFKQGQLITFSGHPDNFSGGYVGAMCWDIKNVRIEKTTDEDIKNLNKFYVKQKSYEKEQQKKRLAEEKKEDEQRKIEEKKKKEEDQYVSVEGHLYIGANLYMKNGDKMELVAKVLDINNHYTDSNGYTYRAVKIQEYETGDVYWKDRNKMIISEVWFVKNNKK